MRTLHTIEAIFEVLGGTKNVAALTGANIKAVRNWKTYFGAFPANTYRILIDELERQHNCTASPAHWKMRGFTKQQKTQTRAVAASNSNRKKTKRAA